MQSKKNFNLDEDLKCVLDSTDSLWKNIKDKKIFLTGGTGFFGKWLLASFIFANEQKKLNATITVLTRNSSKFLQYFPHLANGLGVTLLKGDIRDFKFPEDDFDYVIHAATEADSKFIAERPDEMYSVIVDGTKHILEMCVAKEVKRLLYVSSGAVYGVQPPELLNIAEDYPCAPVNAYGKGKIDAENMCLASSIDTVIARCFAFVGPYLPLDKHFAIGNFINNVLNDEDINIKGDGTPYRSYMYASDLTEWLLTLLLKGKTNESYNVGSDKAISITELAKLICEYSLTGNTRVKIAKKAIDGIKASRYLPDITKCLNLGLKLKVSLKEGIKKTINKNSI